MKTKKTTFLIFIAIAILFIVPIIILKLHMVLMKRVYHLPGKPMDFYEAFPTPGGDLQFIEANVEIRIPPSASEIYACLGCSYESDSRVRFNLPPPDFPLFLKSTYCEKPFVSVNPEHFHHREHDPEWWQPGKANDLAECMGGTSYTHQQIMVDRSDKKSLIVYVLTLIGQYETPTEITDSGRTPPY